MINRIFQRKACSYWWIMLIIGAIFVNLIAFGIPPIRHLLGSIPAPKTEKECAVYFLIWLLATIILALPIMIGLYFLLATKKHYYARKWLGLSCLECERYFRNIYFSYFDPDSYHCPVIGMKLDTFITIVETFPDRFEFYSTYVEFKFRNSEERDIFITSLSSVSPSVLHEVGSDLKNMIHMLRTGTENRVIIYFPDEEYEYHDLYCVVSKTREMHHSLVSKRRQDVLSNTAALAFTEVLKKNILEIEEEAMNQFNEAAKIVQTVAENLDDN